MFEPVDFQPRPYEGPSQTVRIARRGYSRRSADSYADRPSRLTPRQANFYENLIQIALAMDSDVIPVDFTVPGGDQMYLDHGCIKIAEHAGFICRLENDAAGLVGSIRLTWRASSNSGASGGTL